LDAGGRFIIGLFKKFVIADALAVFALNANTAPHISSSGWYWILLYAYAFQIYFDFSGYTDIAIGLAKVMGINLPENFNSPYLKPNITLFWNSWHMTLTQWFRAYFFNPLQRGLRSSRVQIAPWLLILMLQVATMVLIGLWHGVVLNFVIWGVWHGTGLFLHNRWREYMSSRFYLWAVTPLRKNILTTSGIFLTFHFVTLGWVFFLLPANQIPMAVKMLLGFKS
jgi:D-alanyl-lipoteichoic acid acyltransferase DltB (MBOAT superfamily)